MINSTGIGPTFLSYICFLVANGLGIANKQLWLFAYKFSDSDGNMYRYTDGKKVMAVHKERVVLLYGK